MEKYGLVRLNKGADGRIAPEVPRDLVGDPAVTGKVPGKRSVGSVTSYSGSLVFTSQRVLGTLSTVPKLAGRAIDLRGVDVRLLLNEPSDRGDIASHRGVGNLAAGTADLARGKVNEDAEGESYKRVDQDDQAGRDGQRAQRVERLARLGRHPPPPPPPPPHARPRPPPAAPPADPTPPTAGVCTWYDVGGRGVRFKT